MIFFKSASASRRTDQYGANDTPPLSTGPQATALIPHLSVDIRRDLATLAINLSWAHSPESRLNILASPPVLALRNAVFELCDRLKLDPRKEWAAFAGPDIDNGPTHHNPAITDIDGGMKLAKLRHGDPSPDRKMSQSSSLRKVERGEALSVLHSAAVPPALRTLIMQARQNLQGVPASGRFAKMCEPTQIRAMEGIASLRKTIGPDAARRLEQLLA